MLMDIDNGCLCEGARRIGLGAGKRNQIAEVLPAADVDPQLAIEIEVLQKAPAVGPMEDQGPTEIVAPGATGTDPG